MSKIFFVDDDLNVSALIDLFGKYLSAEEKDRLKNLPMKTNQLIRQALQGNPFLDVEYDFIQAIRKIETGFEQYSFFIIDRNLFDKSPYNPVNVVKPLDIEFQQEEEGDYLFFLLFDKYLKYANPITLLENFYFLTAYPKENTTIKESLGKLFLFFPPDHIIPKGQEQPFIEQKINRFEDLVLKAEHRVVFEIFEKGYLGRNFEQDLLSVLKCAHSQDASEIKKNVNLLREIFQEAVRKIVEVDPIHQTMSPKMHQSGNLNVTQILEFLNGTPTKANNSNPTTTEYFSNGHYLLTVALWKACSEIAHGGISGTRTFRYLPTHYSLPGLMNIFMDFLVWFSDFMEQH